MSSYRSVWDGWIAFVLAHGLSWDNAQSQDVRDFLLALPARASARGISKPSAVTQKRYYRVLKEIYACACANGWIDQVPTDHAAAVSRTEAHESLVFHRGQWQRLFAALPEVRDPPPLDVGWTEVRNLALLLLMMHAALTVGELTALNLEHVHSPRFRTLVGGTLVVDLPYPPWEAVPAPTRLHISGSRPDQTRELVLGAPAAPALMAWLALRVDMVLPEGLQSPLFISRKGAGRLTSKTLFTLANAHIQRTLGPEMGDVALAHAGPMTLRSSCMVRWLDAGTPDHEVLRRAGLKDIEALNRLRQHVVHSADLSQPMRGGA